MDTLVAYYANLMCALIVTTRYERWLTIRLFLVVRLSKVLLQCQFRPSTLSGLLRWRGVVSRCGLNCRHVRRMILCCPHKVLQWTNTLLLLLLWLWEMLHPRVGLDIEASRCEHLQRKGEGLDCYLGTMRMSITLSICTCRLVRTCWVGTVYVYYLHSIPYSG